ncbi:uncharacterized protein LOC125665298 [Ostrea edulis]|uniref:uncharacterized protein LOC125665298 n=1 Tax=Ostrea edulis TaxID=37623 RepID=UPI00209639D1|nr:uncharacterized protein LOC125665298 [Ostrea edulis]
MNLHIDKIECLFILFNILISSAKLTSSYKLKHIILAQYIGNSQNGISSNGASLAKQILLTRSKSKQNYEVGDEKSQLVDKKTRGSLLDYRPYVHVIIDGRTGDSDGPLFQTDVALSPGMSLYNAIAQASIRFGVEHPCIQNPYQMEVESVSRNCYTVVNVPGLPAGRNNKWIIKIVRRRGRVVYEGECLPSGRIAMRGGTMVTFTKSS